MKDVQINKEFYQDLDEVTSTAVVFSGASSACIHLRSPESEKLVLRAYQGASKKEFQKAEELINRVCSEGSALYLEDLTKSKKRLSKDLLKSFNFYFGIPVKDKNNEIVGVLSVVDKNPKKLSSIIQKSLRTLAKTAMMIYQNMHMEEYKRSCLNSMLELNNGFYMKVTKNLLIKEVGPNFRSSIPGIVKGSKLFDFFEYQSGRNFDQLFRSEKWGKEIHFFDTKDGTQRYKFSYLLFEDDMVIAASPIINTKYLLSNYKINLNDFSRHDYIAEFMFLQQTSGKSLMEAREISENLVKKNIQLNQAQKRIGELSKFPSENPHPILRFDKHLELVYNNAASEINFNKDFKIRGKRPEDKRLLKNLKKVIKSESTEHFFESRNERHYSLSVVYVKENEYINIYANDISDFVNKVNQNEKALISLKDEIQNQKEFYEFILNNMPADVAVFDKKHRYVFINPQGIGNIKLRKYMIGKDDFDYAKYKNIPDDKAVERRKIFNKIIRTKKFISWQDEFVDSIGNRKVVQRTMGPLFDEKGRIRFIIGYGTDITKRVVIEESNVRLSLVAKNTNNGVVMLDKERKITWANSAFLRRSGYKLEEVVGKSSEYFTYPSQTEHVVDKVKKAFNSKEKISVEIMRQSKSGKEYWVDLNAQPLLNEKNEVTGYMLVEFDITDRIRNEQTIQNLNVNLERMVQDKTAKNIILSNSLRDQEKMVTIGELAAGVAHDLNTPLGAIKSGTHNMDYTLNNLLGEDLAKCSKAEIEFANQRSRDTVLDLYVGGLQVVKEKMEFEKFLETKGGDLSEKQISDISELLVKNRIAISDKESIDIVLKSKHPVIFLNVMYNIQVIRSFINTITTSGEKASLVVQDLRSFIREKKNTVLTKVNLYENIKTVLNIFNHNIKNRIDLEFSVNKNIYVQGYDVRLFQLWSNLIKNSIECMEDMEGEKKLKVVSRDYKKTCSITVENNGPMIPENMRDRIFDKFFTTKGNKSGSGLGLSIVKNVLEEHNARIDLSSIEGRTSFKITFNKDM